MKLELLNKALILAFAISAPSAVLATGMSKSTEGSGKTTGGAGSSSSMEKSSSFSTADRDNNGYLDSNEASKVRGLDFQTADTNKDGHITRTEFEAAMKNARGRAGGTMPKGSSGSTSGNMGSSSH